MHEEAYIILLKYHITKKAQWENYTTFLLYIC